MKKIVFYISILVAILAVSSCKTTEKNYREAYEIARDARKTNVDSETSQKIARESKGEKRVINGDSVNVKMTYLTVVDGLEKDAHFPQYGVCVAQFKQVFNAKSFMKRLKEKEYPAYIVKDRDGIFYVIAQGTDFIEMTTNDLSKFKSQPPFPIPSEPFILARP